MPLPAPPLARLLLLLLLHATTIGDAAEGEEAEMVEEEQVVEVLPGWRAPHSWPTNGITKTHFRENYGGSWDAVSTVLGGMRRRQIKQLKTQELRDQIDARHQKLGLQGTSQDTVVFGPANDWTSTDRRHWTLASAYSAMHNKPYTLNEAGHAGQPIFTARSDSKFGAEPTTYRHELDRDKLLRKVTYTESLEVNMDLEQLPKRLAELEQILAASYRCVAFPHGMDSDEQAGEFSCGAADTTSLEQEIAAIKSRIVELQRDISDEQGSVDFTSDDVFDEIDTDGDNLASLEEISTWAIAVALRGEEPSTARTGSLRKASLVSPNGEISHDPEPGTCAYAVRAACVGTVDDVCTDCVKAHHRDKALRAACPTWALVTEACAAGSIADDVWSGLVRDAHFVITGTEKVLEDRFVDRITTSLSDTADHDMMEKAKIYIDEKVKRDAATQRERLVNEFILQNT